MHILPWVCTFLILAPAAGQSIADVFRAKTCLSSTPPFPFDDDDNKWVLELNPWTSHELVSTIAGIILREGVGYAVDFNVVQSNQGAIQRANSKSAYGNFEVWLDDMSDDYAKYVTSDKDVIDHGTTGYIVQKGLFVSRQFAWRNDFDMPVEHYISIAENIGSMASRTYVGNQRILDSLRNDSGISCNQATVCHSQPGTSCPQVLPHADGIRWCPSSGASTLPSVFSGRIPFGSPYIEQVVQSNGLHFALHWINDRDLSFTRSLAYLTSADGRLVFTWNPSYLLARLQTTDPTNPIRVSFPTFNCEPLQESLQQPYPLGRRSCEFQEILPHKISSNTVLDDPVSALFYDKFGMSGQPNYNSSHPVNLVGAGVEHLLASLAFRVPSSSNRLPTSNEIFDVACEWVQANEKKGQKWSAWVLRRDVPFFADTESSSYPWPILIFMFVVAAFVVIFTETCFLGTTLSPKTYKRIIDKNPDTQYGSALRSEVEQRLRQEQREIIKVTTNENLLTPDKTTVGVGDTKIDMEEETIAEGVMPPKYWEGLADRISNFPKADTFWKRVEDQSSVIKPLTEFVEKTPPPSDLVRFTMHTFPCVQCSGEVVIALYRSEGGVKSGQRLTVSLVAEECGGGAKAGNQFQAQEYVAEFGNGNHLAIVRLPIKHNKDKFENTTWFQVRLTAVKEGNALLSYPDTAFVLILDTDVWPANIPASKRGGHGISLMRYLWKSDTERRGEKWRKCMAAMLWLPVHGVLVTTIVQKILVDHVVSEIQSSAKDNTNPNFFYYEGVILVLIQMISLASNRWADVVQTRNRGRTGGVRQVHRLTMIRKYLIMEHAEHWIASDANWFYSAVYDANVITGQAYFQVYVLFQSLFALLLSTLIVIGLTIWSYVKAAKKKSGFRPEGLTQLWYLGVLILICVLSSFGVYRRRTLSWITVVARKSREMHFIRALVWVMTQWRSLSASTLAERAFIDKNVNAINADFLPYHQDARDTLNDTQWVTVWLQGISYCFVMLFGLQSMIEYSTFGIGTMEVGTYYALLKVFGTFGKYTGKLSDVWADFQKAIVSIRDIAAMLNQMEQTSQRRFAAEWSWYFDKDKFGDAERGKSRGLDVRSGEQSASLVTDTHMKRLLNLGVLADNINDLVFEAGVSFQRPPGRKTGMIFGEFKFNTELRIPIGRTVILHAQNEAIVNSVLGIISGVIHPAVRPRTERSTENLTVSMTLDSVGTVNADEHFPSFRGARHLRYKMIPLTATTNSFISGTIIEQLKMSGAPVDLCSALAQCVGLDPEASVTSLPVGSAQVFTIVNALLYDPDVLCSFQPLAVVPAELRHKILMLFFIWQLGGGLPKLAEHLELPYIIEPEKQVHRSQLRSLILGRGSMGYDYSEYRSVIEINLDTYLWRPEGEEIIAEPTKLPDTQI